jgi:two-component sensor histidine kinase
LADGDILNTSNFLQNLSEAQEETGNSVGALASFKQYKKLCDSIYNQDNSTKINGIETQRDLDLKDQEIKINGLELTKKRNQQVFFFMGIGLLAVITGNVTRNNRKQKRVNKLLTAEKVKSDVLAKNLGISLEQKDLLMKEIHHRVKNNLQVISALLELQLENVSDEHAIDAMTESTSRVRSISLIHQQLYQVEDISSIEFSKFASDLFKQISIVFNKTGSTISLDNNIAEAWQDIDTAVPLGLILNELLTNSYKYAFAGVETGTISIKLELQKDNFYHLLYSDNGPGLPENFKMEGLKSLGMRVIRNLSKQIGGRFYYDFDTKVFHVTFKDLAERKRIA